MFDTPISGVSDIRPISWTEHTETLSQAHIVIGLTLCCPFSSTTSAQALRRRDGGKASEGKNGKGDRADQGGCGGGEERDAAEMLSESSCYIGCPFSSTASAKVLLCR